MNPFGRSLWFVALFISLCFAIPEGYDQVVNTFINLTNVCAESVFPFINVFYMYFDHDNHHDDSVSVQYRMGL